MYQNLNTTAAILPYRILKMLLICTYFTFVSPPALLSQQLGEYPIITDFEQVPFNQLQEAQIAYSPSEEPFGNSYASWCEAWVKYFYSIPCNKHPLAESADDKTEPDQVGPVYFLAGTLGGTIERTVIIPEGKGIFFPVLNYVANYPCPYAGSKPAPGQSLKDFLVRNANVMVDQGTLMSVTLDGVRISDLLPFRTTTELFYFQALPELTCLDPCVTGELQPGVADGYWIMLRPLSPGQHKLNYKGSYPKLGWAIDVTYTIEVE